MQSFLHSTMKENEFLDQLCLWLKIFEGFKPEAYYDSNGIPTIGYGINLFQKSNLSILINNGRLDLFHQDLEKLKKISNSTSETDADLKEKINKLIAKYNIEFDSAYSEKRQLKMNENQASNFLKKRIKVDIEDIKKNNAILKHFLDSDQYCYEGIALMSLYCNNPKLIGTNLQNAIINDDRFKAWFEIRYRSNGKQSNGQQSKSLGIAKRRFAESNCFGLLEHKTKECYSIKEGKIDKTVDEADWSKQCKPTFKETLNFFHFLYLLTNDPTNPTINHFQHIKTYETDLKDQISKKPNTQQIFLEFKKHYIHYTTKFAPFVQVLNTAIQETGATSQLKLDNIFNINKSNQCLITTLITPKLEETKDEKEAEIAIIVEKECGVGFFQEKLQNNLQTIHIILHSGNVDICGFTNPKNLHFYIVDEKDQGKLCHLQGCPTQAIREQTLSCGTKTLQGLIGINDNEGMVYCFEKQADNCFSPNLKIYDKTTLTHLVTIFNLTSQEKEMSDPKNSRQITQNKQDFSHLCFYLQATQPNHSTDSSKTTQYQTLKQRYTATKTQFFIQAYHYHTKTPLQGVTFSYNNQEATSDDEGFASFAFELENKADFFRVYSVLTQSKEYITMGNFQYSCAINSCPTKNKAYRMPLLKVGEVAFQDCTLMFEFKDYPLKDIVFPRTHSTQSLPQDFFKEAFLSSNQSKRNYLRIQNNQGTLAYLTHKKEFITSLDIGLLLEEKDFRHLQQALEETDVDLYRFTKTEDFFYLKEIEVSSSYEGRSASDGIDDTLIFKAKFSKNHPKAQETQWGYLSFAYGEDCLKTLEILSKGGSVAIHTLEEFQILQDNQAPLKGQEIHFACPIEWRDRQILLFAYLNAPDLKHSILLLPLVTQEKEEEILITSLETPNPEEYLKFVFPKNVLPHSQSILKCEEFILEDLVCQLEALSLQEKPQEKPTLHQDVIRRHIHRFSKTTNKAHQREVEFEEELDRLFVQMTKNATQRKNTFTPNQSNLEEVTLEDGTKIIRSRAYREFNKVEQKFLDEAVLVQIDGRSVAQRTKAIDLQNKVSLQNMKEGKAPLGKDGKIMELHHLQQKEEGILLELTYTEHKENSRALHGYKKESEIDRKKFAKFKKGYWKARAEGLEKKS